MGFWRVLGASCKRALLVFLSVSGGSTLAGEEIGEAQLAKYFLEKAGISRGFCAFLGTEDGKLALEIIRQSRFFVHVLGPEASAIAAARETLDRGGFYGTRALADGELFYRLPYAGNMVDLVLAQSPADGEGLLALPADEIQRVLRPGGRVVLLCRKGPQEEGITVEELGAGIRKRGVTRFRVVSERVGLWAVITKPIPEGMDSWSHWEHGPDNNPVSNDKGITAPYRTQWFGGPYYIAMPAITTAAGGRLFTAMGHIAHHQREEGWLNTILARNGYNGMELWRRKLPDGYLVHRSAFIATDDRFYMIEGDGCLILDPKTGETLERIRIPGLRGEWKYIAMADGILYVLSGEEPDASETTIVRSVHGHWSWGELSPGYYQDRIPWGFGSSLAAYDLGRRQVRWIHEHQRPIDSRSLALGGGKIYFYAPKAHTGCLDGGAGKVLWTNDDPKVIEFIEQPGRGLTSTPGFRTSCYSLYSPEALFLQAQTRMNVVAISTKDGHLLWSRKKTTNNPNMLFVDGKLVVGIGPGGNTLVLDPLTGETLKDLGFKKRSCARLTATEDSFFCRGWPEGLTRYDRKSEQILFNGALRPACNDGAIAANGMLYIGPWLCDCNLSLMGTVGWCSAGEFRVEDEDPVEARLESVENPSPASFPEVTPQDWPLYRGNLQRNSSSPVSLSGDPKPLWTFRPPVPYTPSAPSAAGDLIFLCGDDGKVLAIDAQTGRLAWLARTSGPIPQPPTIWSGRAFVGSGDGFVYALEAASGRQLWRFRAAPKERRILVHDRLCSTWPVGSGILVQDGVAYAAAGIIDYDGTYVCALDAVTGRPKWRNTTSGHLDRTLRKGISPQGILAIAGGRLWMPGGNVISPAGYTLDDGRCLTGAVLDGSPRSNRGEEIGVLKGEYLIFGGRLKYSALRNYVNPGNFAIGKLGPEGLTHGLMLGSGKIAPAWSETLLIMANGPNSLLAAVEVEKLEELVEKSQGQDVRGQQRLLRGLERRWVAQELNGSDAVAIALAANAVLVVSEIPRPRSRFSAWNLNALDRETGKVLWKQPLPSAALAGGLLVNRHGHIIVILEDGSVACFGEKLQEF